jgi:hypothetical protein
MNVSKMAMNSALVLTAGIAVALTPTGYPGHPLPLVTLRSHMFPATRSCHDGACNSPADGRPEGPASVLSHLWMLNFPPFMAAIPF